MLGAAAYLQGEAFQREKRSLFSRTWLPFCAGAQVAGAGDFVSHSLGGWSLFVVRGKDDALRAFHNTCRHQQMPVVEKPGGRCDMLRCRYHGWTYDLTGALAAAPPMVAPPDPRTVRLGPVELAETDPLVFVRIEAGPDAPPSVGVEGRRLAATTTTDAACNWKTYVEMLLAVPAWHFVWPLAFRQTRGDVQVVRQIVPRSFIRTRIVEFVFAGAATDGPPAEIAAAADKAHAEALQEQRAAGAMGTEGPALRDFRARVAAACGDPVAP